MFTPIALALLVSANSLPEPPSQGAELMRPLITALGSRTGPDDLENIEQTFGCAAVPVLVGELRTTRETELFADAQADHPAAMHLTFVVAALRYITGNEFTAEASRHDLRHHSENAKYWLTFQSPPGQARFISYWPSHGTLYFGPIKTQERIIEQWHAFARSGQCRPSSRVGRGDGAFYLGGITE